MVKPKFKLKVSLFVKLNEYKQHFSGLISQTKTKLFINNSVHSKPYVWDQFFSYTLYFDSIHTRYFFVYNKWERGIQIYDL